MLATPTSAPAIRLATSADANLLAQGTQVAVAGWGDTSSTQTTPPTALHWGASVVQGQTFCANEEYIDGVPFDPTDAICALDAPSLAVATCHGDSGGPLVAGDSAGDPVEIGVTSRGDPLCNPDFPSVFTRVDAISAWAQSVIAANPVAAVRAAVATPATPAAPSSAAAAGSPSPRAALPAAGAYGATTASARESVSVRVGTPAGARASIRLRFTLACPTRRSHAARLSVTPHSGPSTAWHFSSSGLLARRWRYRLSGSFHAPATISGSFRVTTLNGRCSTGRVRWSARATRALSAAPRDTATPAGRLDIRSIALNNSLAPGIPAAEAQSTTEVGDDSHEVSNADNRR